MEQGTIRSITNTTQKTEMSKILLINAHPNPAKSVANNAIIAEVTRRLPEINVHNIADSCRNGAFDLALEHKLLTDHDIIVFQFPLYWFSVPGLLKQWFDDVLTHGFAYGTSGTALKDKLAVFSFTAGEDISSENPVIDGTPVKAMCAPLFLTANYCRMRNTDPVFSGGMMFIEGVSTEDDLKGIKARSQAHGEALAALLTKAA